MRRKVEKYLDYEEFRNRVWFSESSLLKHLHLTEKACRGDRLTKLKKRCYRQLAEAGSISGHEYRRLLDAIDAPKHQNGSRMQTNGRRWTDTPAPVEPPKRGRGSQPISSKRRKSRSKSPRVGDLVRIDEKSHRMMFDSASDTYLVSSTKEACVNCSQYNRYSNGHCYCFPFPAGLYTFLPGPNDTFGLFDGKIITLIDSSSNMSLYPVVSRLNKKRKKRKSYENTRAL